MFRSIPHFAGAAALSLLLVLTACTGDAGRDIAGPSFDHNGCEGSGEEHELDGGFCGETTNNPPTVSAGEDQVVDMGTLVTLSGSAEDPEGDVIASVVWVQVGGPGVLLLGHLDDPLKASFQAPTTDNLEETLTFRFTATDELGASNYDEVSVTIQNTDPCAGATCADCTDSNGNGVCDSNDPIPVPTQIQALIEQVTAAGFDKNTAKSLLSLLQNASANYEKGDTAGAIDKLTSLVNQLSALNGRKGVNTSALIAAANAIIAQLTTP